MTVVTTINRIMIAAVVAMATPQMAHAADGAAMHDAPACTAPGTLTPALYGWTMLGFRDAATTPAALPASVLPVGDAVLARLAPTPAVTYARRPEKPGAADSYGGMWRIVVPARGTYRVVLGTHAWLDLVAANGSAVAAVAHDHGPACTGIRKLVDFALDPGSYTLQIAGNATPRAQVMVIRLP
ncbi:homogentisate 1,2-dioxygenase [Novosphingobium sp.]|uniref:homogentisate 1,2-dioxygenase n=1 Tax=Novosphingobium sp. TaxID=1874826 RepID=UPI003342BB86